MNKTKDHRTFHSPRRLFFSEFGRVFLSLENWLKDAYPFYKTRELNRLLDEEILNSSNEILIKKIMVTRLSTIELKEPIFFSFKDHDNHSKTDIHIPYHGTMSTFSYCPDELMHDPPNIYAESYNIPNADSYDPNINWAGEFSTSHSSENNVLMLIFSDDELENIKPTLDYLRRCIHICNRVIKKYEEQEIPLINEAINKKRHEIVSKRNLLNNMGLISGTFKSKEENTQIDSSPDPSEKYRQEKRRGGQQRHRQTTEIKEAIIKPMFLNKAQIKGPSTKYRAKVISDKLCETGIMTDRQIKDFSEKYGLEFKVLNTSKSYFLPEKERQIYDWCRAINKEA
jgi:hypothetical protein